MKLGLKLAAINAIALFVLSGCATALRGTSDVMIINYTPSDASITTSLGHSCSGSPCEFEVPRKKCFRITANRDGYQGKIVDVMLEVPPVAAVAAVGSLMVGMAAGAAADAMAGGTFDHTPNPVSIRLTPIGQPIETPAPTTVRPRTCLGEDWRSGNNAS